MPVEAARFESTSQEAWQAPPALEWRHFSPRDEETFAATPAPRRDWRRIAAGVSMASVVAIGGAVAAVHVREMRFLRADTAETRTLTHRLDSLSARFESLEANRIRDELASQRKVLAEIKAGVASAHDVGGAVGQLAARVERLEKEQGAKLDKLGERMDRDAAGRLADVAARLDKLEAKAAPVVVAAPAKPSPSLKADAPKVEPTVSNETTGSIEKPRPRLRGFYLAEIHNGYAMIDGPAGQFAVAPGDVVPGGGRVIRIERHGRDWVVVTTQGQITAMND